MPKAIDPGAACATAPSHPSRRCLIRHAASALLAGAAVASALPGAAEAAAAPVAADTVLLALCAESRARLADYRAIIDQTGNLPEAEQRWDAAPLGAANEAWILTLNQIAAMPAFTEEGMRAKAALLQEALVERVAILDCAPEESIKELGEPDQVLAWSLASDLLAGAPTDGRGAAPAAHPARDLDAELLRLHRDFVAAAEAWDANDAALQATPDPGRQSDLLRAEEGISRRYVRAMEAIEATPARTLAGVRAKAEALAIEWKDSPAAPADLTKSLLQDVLALLPGGP